MEEKEIIADLHIHSRFSRATSKSIDIPNLVKYAKIKGLNLLGTGDFTHPEWLSEIKQLYEKDGLYYYDDFPFILSSEISLMYTQDGKGRRVHLVLLAPSLEVVDKINKWLDTKGRRDYDGRPIFGFSCTGLVEEMEKISKDIEVIPAHIWTPWFGIFGSMSGFDSLKQAFGDKVGNIHAIETGLSSDPMMNWRIKELNNKSIISFSDAHSFWPWRIGREATVFELEELNYDNIIKAIRTRQGLKETIEISPLFGKYHLTGHRNCNFSCSPEETKKLDGICPICKKSLTVGVEERVEELADRPEGYVPEGAIPFKTLIPLHELLAGLLKTSVTSKKVWEEYNKLIERFGNEFNILLKASQEELIKVVPMRIADVILMNRLGKIKVKGGFDGNYGVLVLESLDNEDMKLKGQKGLGEFM